jgi:uncharacterized phiE125 gp8 family phage protein
MAISPLALGRMNNRKDHEMPGILPTAPAVEPITPADAKAYLRVEHTDDDALIGSLIAAARLHVERLTRRALITQVWRFVFDAWPADGRIAVPLAPLRQLTAVRTYDAAGVSHALDVGTFLVDISAAPGRVAFPPWTVSHPGRATAGIELDIEAGYGAAGASVPEPLRQAMRLLVVHWYEHRGVVEVGSASTPLPAGVASLLALYRVVSL